MEDSIMENSSNEKIIEKIKKVLELSKNNPSIEEAKSAAIKAQRLMAEYHISMSEIEAIEDTENIVEERIDVGTGNKWKYTLSSIIAKNFRCKYFYYGKSSVVFYGYEEDAKIVAMTFKLLFEVGNKESAKYYQKERQKYLNVHNIRFDGRGIKNAFLNGYLIGIKESLEKQCTALMIVVPKKVEEKYIDRTSSFHSFSSSFRIRINQEGERAKEEGERIGRGMIEKRRIEVTCQRINDMDINRMIKIIRKEYAEVVKALKEAETDYNANRRSVKKREEFQFVAAQEMELSELCRKLGIEL